MVFSSGSGQATVSASTTCSVLPLLGPVSVTTSPAFTSYSPEKSIQSQGVGPSQYSVFTCSSVEKSTPCPFEGSSISKWTHSSSCHSQPSTTSPSGNTVKCGVGLQNPKPVSSS